jgi:hypothetical protein
MCNVCDQHIKHITASGLIVCRFGYRAPERTARACYERLPEAIVSIAVAMF